jgi:hypothetical protein
MGRPYFRGRTSNQAFSLGYSPAVIANGLMFVVAFVEEAAATRTFDHVINRGFRLDRRLAFKE